MKSLMDLTEEDIRPTNSVKHCREVLYHRDLEKFFIKYGKELKWLHTCLVCGSADIPPYAVKDNFRFSQCRSCRMVFINPRPTEEQLQWYYSSAESPKYATKILRDTVDHRTVIYRDRAEKIMQRVKEFQSVKKVLEIGCGPGAFLKVFREMLGCDSPVECMGIDMDPYAVELAGNLGIKVERDSGEEYSRKHAAATDLLLSFETLEHTPNPLSFARSMKRLIRKGGSIYLTLPNFWGFDFLELGTTYQNFFGPSHLNYFNPDSIVLLLKRAGFKNVNVYSDGVLDVDIVRKYVEKKIIKPSPFWSHVFVNSEKYIKFMNEFQLLLQKYMLSGNMSIVAEG